MFTEQIPNRRSDSSKQKFVIISIFSRMHRKCNEMEPLIDVNTTNNDQRIVVFIHFIGPVGGHNAEF